MNNTLFAQYKSAEALKVAHKGGGVVLTGIVTSVGDADGLRFYHIPSAHRILNLKWITSTQEERAKLVRGNTISVRLGGIDAPEFKHGAGRDQPFALDAWKFLVRELVPSEYDAASKAKKRFVTADGRRVRVHVLGYDQYSRVLGYVMYKPWPALPIWRNVSIEMLKEGLAEVYRQGNAKYGGLDEELDAAETEAKRKKVGIWGQKKYIRPSEYKNQHKNGTR